MSFLVENIDKNIKIKKIEELLKSLELQKNGIITEITSIQSMINNLQTEINKLQTEINIAQKEYQYTIITRLQSKKQIYNVQKSALQIDIDAKQRILNNIQISLDNLNKELKSFSISAPIYTQTSQPVPNFSSASAYASTPIYIPKPIYTPTSQPVPNFSSAPAYLSTPVYRPTIQPVPNFSSVPAYVSTPIYRQTNQPAPSSESVYIPKPDYTPTSQPVPSSESMIQPAFLNITNEKIKSAFKIVGLKIDPLIIILLIMIIIIFYK
jgi:hypothetical protein